MASMKRRASPGYSYEPCHGCGSENQHPKGQLCNECSKELTEARLINAAAKANPARSVRRFPKADRSHDVMGYYGNRIDSAASRGLQQAIVDLAWTVVTEAGYVHNADGLLPLHRDSGYIDSYVWADNAFVEKLNALDVAIRTALENVARNNRQEGQSLLLQLASGELSMNDFDKQTTKRRD